MECCKCGDVIVPTTICVSCENIDTDIKACVCSKCSSNLVLNPLCANCYDLCIYCHELKSATSQLCSRCLKHC